MHGATSSLTVELVGRIFNDPDGGVEALEAGLEHCIVVHPHGLPQWGGARQGTQKVQLLSRGYVQVVIRGQVVGPGGKESRHRQHCSA